MPKMWGERGVPTQVGAQDSPSSTYYRGNADIAFVVGQMVMFRFPSNIPKGATINSAVLVLNMYSNKDAAGSYTLDLRMQSIGDSPPLVEGVAESNARLRTVASVSWANTWTPNVSDVETRTSPSLVAMVQEVVNLPDWQPGGYLTMMALVTAESGDMRSRLNNDFIQRPALNIDWSVPAAENRRSTINLVENPNYDPALDRATVDPADSTSNLGYWRQGAFYGAYVDAANMGTIARDTSFTRVAGRSTMKFTTGTPSGDGKATGPYTVLATDGPVSHVFAGWLYIPSSVTETVKVEMPYFGGQTDAVVAARDQWVPFCTRAYAPGETGGAARWFAVAILGPWAAGRSIWLSEPMIVEADFAMHPFNAKQADTDVIDFYPGFAGAMQHGNRQWTPKRSVLVGGVQRQRSSWVKTAGNLFVLAEPVKGSVPVTSLTSGAITTLTQNIGDL